LVIPITLFSGAGGMILPTLRYFSDSLSWRPKKSLKRLVTENSRFLNMGMLVFCGYPVSHVGAHSLAHFLRLGDGNFQKLVAPRSFYLKFDKRERK
jgi:hypothetical protein